VRTADNRTVAPASGGELGYTPPAGEVVAAHEPTVLVVASDVVGSRMAGPGIRVVEMCRLLARQAAVTLAVDAPTDLQLQGVQLLRPTPRALAELAAAADVVVCPGLSLARFPYLASFRAPVVVDAYDPFWIAVLEQQRHKPPAERAADERHTRTGLLRQLRLGDFFLCATERQRDMLLGGLCLLGRPGPALRERDPALRSLVATVPFGLPSAPPKPADRPLLRGVVPGVGHDDLLLLWAGGIYNWFDPVSLVRAVGLAAADHPEVKLVFFGGTHPNPDVPSMRVAAEALQAARAEGLLDRHVFFLDQWVPYEQRAGYLLEADVGVSAHLDNVETTFAFRTRFLDYLWAGLPVLCTGGDELGDLAGERGFGLVVPPGDVQGLAGAIRRLAADRGELARLAAAARATAPAFRWERTLAPLAEFVDAPRGAPDRPRDRVARRRPVHTTLAWRVARLHEFWREHGTRRTAGLLVRKLRRG
jgi:glycosyltransferase involved in cell wall biosynthesis